MTATWNWYRSTILEQPNDLILPGRAVISCLRQEGLLGVAGPFFPNSSWPAFIYKGKRYDLAHLDEYILTVIDTDGFERHIAVNFSDHCFTRNPVAGDDPALAYPTSERRPGHFCFERHSLSLGLRNHIGRTAAGQVWNVNEGNFAAVPIVGQSGDEVQYGIIFSLDPVTGLPVHLHMRVKSAYPMDHTELVTYGSVRFRHLVALRLKGRKPNKLFDARRKKPRKPDERRKKK
jgi:hypothetical protein